MKYDLTFLRHSTLTQVFKVDCFIFLITYLPG